MVLEGEEPVLIDCTTDISIEVDLVILAEYCMKISCSEIEKKRLSISVRGNRLYRFRRILLHKNIFKSLKEVAQLLSKKIKLIGFISIQWFVQSNIAHH